MIGSGGQRCLPDNSAFGSLLMARIKCFGTFWRRDLIEWGEEGRNSFDIYGWRPSYKHWHKVSDEHHIEVNSQVGIYALHQSDRTIVYIGQAGRGEHSRLGNRLWQHTRNENADRWTHFSWFGLNAPSKEAEEAEEANGADLPEKTIALNELEALLITMVEPKLNKRGGDWGDATRYLQYSYIEDTRNGEIWNQNKKHFKKLLKRLDLLEKRMGETEV